MLITTVGLWTVSKGSKMRNNRFLSGLADPIRAMAVGSTGVATCEEFGCPEGTEDTITIVCEWKNRSDGSIGSSVLPTTFTGSSCFYRHCSLYGFMGASEQFGMPHSAEIFVSRA